MILEYIGGPVDGHTQDIDKVDHGQTIMVRVKSGGKWREHPEGFYSGFSICGDRVKCFWQFNPTRKSKQ